MYTVQLYFSTLYGIKWGIIIDRKKCSETYLENTQNYVIINIKVRLFLLTVKVWTYGNIINRMAISSAYGY